MKLIVRYTPSRGNLPANRLQSHSLLRYHVHLLSESLMMVRTIEYQRRDPPPPRYLRVWPTLLTLGLCVGLVAFGMLDHSYIHSRAAIAKPVCILVILIVESCAIFETAASVRSGGNVVAETTQLLLCTFINMFNTNTVISIFAPGPL